MPHVDSDAHYGVGTPITGGLPGIVVEYPLPYTLLSLGRYAQLMGISPLHFWQGVTPGLDPVVFPVTDCSSVWFQHDWQNSDQVSREQVVNAIAEAEGEIAHLLGYWPGPTWIAEEQQMYNRPYDRQYFGNGESLRGNYKAVASDYGRIISVGQRAVLLVGTPTVAAGTLRYSDEDSDGFYETASIVLATTLTDPCDIKVYFTGHTGDPDWEIRPLRKKTISGGVLTIILDSWLLIDRTLYELYPTDLGPLAIDVSTTANYVTSVDVYYEYASTVLPSAAFIWASSSGSCPTCGGTGCNACAGSTSTGCALIRDARAGILAPTPATYDVATGTWTADVWEDCREPDYVQLWYYAGEIDQKYLRGLSCEPLSLYWQQAISWLATARLDRPLCSCGNVQAAVDWLREDLALSETGRSHSLSFSLIDNPLGTLRGEVMAWKRISKLAPKRMNVALA